MGSHQELIAKGEVGNYASLVRLQELAMVKDGTIVSPKKDKSRMSIPDSVNGCERLSNVASKENISRGLAPDEMDHQFPGSNFYRLWKISLSEWKYAIPGFMGSVLSGFLLPVLSMMISQIVRLYYYSDYDLMERKNAMYALIFAGVGIASFGIHFMQHYFLGVMGENLTKWVRIQMFQVILRNEIGWFDQEENNSSQVVSRLALDSITVRSAIVERVSILIQNTSTLFTIFTLCFIMQWRIAFVVLATFPLLVLAAFAENVAMKGFAGDIAKAHSRATMVAGEAVSNIRTVAAFNAEHKVLNSFHDKLGSVENQTLARAQIAGFMYGLSQMCMHSSYALALRYGSQLIKNNITDFGNVIRIFVVVIFGAIAIAEALSLAPDIIKGGQALDSVFQTLDRKTHIDPDHPVYSLMNIKGNIDFKSVEFHYPTRPQATIFKVLDLSIPAGQSLALVGHIGSGKSSIIALIMRFYDPVLGTLMIDKTDIRELDLRALRQHIGLVQQEPALFATTIRENIIYGQGVDEASEEDMVQAATAANADEFIRSLPNGYDTLVGEWGTQLSGGQKQRLAIARAVLRNPRILLLDEATSALDMDSEKVVQDALDKLMVGRTTVMIAHRLSTIRNASIIAVVEEGKIVEKGSHAQLVSKPNSSYWHLLSSQKLNIENNQAN